MTIGFRIHVQRDFEYEPLPHVYDTKKAAESAWYDELTEDELDRAYALAEQLSA